MKWIAVLSCLMMVGSFAEARIFNLNQESFASYLSLHTGGSSVKSSLFDEDSSATDFSKSMTTSMGGEFGFLTRFERMTLRFGFEIMKPTSMKGVSATSSAGTELYKINSAVTGFLPKVGVDLNLVNRASWRLFVYGTVGQSHVTVDQTYSDLSIAPNGDFETQWKGNGNAIAGGVGFEYAALHLTSLVFEVGYRDLKVKKLKYGEDVTDFQGAHSVGDPVTTSGGGNRSLDFSGWTASVGARWWLF